MGNEWRYVPRLHARLGLLLAVVLVGAGCSRGPAAPTPSEDLRPTTVGVVVSTTWALPVTLDDGRVFPPGSSSVRRIKNWPAGDVREPDEIRDGSLLLAGRDADGWWFEIAGGFGPDPDDCWPIYGGSFDEGATIRFSSGLRVPKAAGFEIRDSGYHDVQAFPAHQDDYVCVDKLGRAVFFQLFIGL